MGTNKMIKVKIVQESSLLSVLLDAEISEQQVSMIRMIIFNPDFTYPELLDAMREHDRKLSESEKRLLWGDR